MTYIISREIHPNNETRLTLYREKRKNPSLLSQAASVLGVTTSEVSLLASSDSSPSLLLDIRSEFRTEAEGERFHSHKRTAFGLDARRRISRAAGALDRLDADVSNYLFLTATLPGDTDEAKWGIAEYAHEIIDGLKSWLSKRLLDRKEFYVWENQKRGALHFHYCIYCPDKSTQAEITANFKTQMVRLYDGVREKRNCDLWGKYSHYSAADKAEVLQARVEVVYKSVGSYMAGYLAGSGNKHAKDANHRYYPKRWFGVSRPLSAAMDSMTERTVVEFDSLREANEFYHSDEQDFLDESLTDKSYTHKVGEGKTHVFYHTTEKQQELWQAKKMLTHKPDNHPHIAHFAATLLKSIHELREALKKSASLRGAVPNELQTLLRAYTSTTSLKHGVLKREMIKALEKVFCIYDFSSSSCLTTKGCFPNLLLCNLMAAHYHPQMRFNSWGILNNEADFSQWVDKRRSRQYRSTTTDEVVTPNELDGYSGHVPGELGSSSSHFEPCQILLFHS